MCTCGASEAKRHAAQHATRIFTAHAHFSASVFFEVWFPVGTQAGEPQPETAPSVVGPTDSFDLVEVVAWVGGGLEDLTPICTHDRQRVVFLWQRNFARPREGRAPKLDVVLSLWTTLTTKKLGPLRGRCTASIVLRK